MKVLLTTLNAKYIHKNLALRWIYQACPYQEDVDVLEFTIKDDLDRVKEKILAGGYDVVCFSVYIWNIEPIKQVVTALKLERPALHILVGGPEVSYESYELIEQGIDAISIGEGEQSVWEYITMLKSGSRYEVAGIYTKEFPNTTYRKVDIAFLETLEDPYFMEMDASDMEKRYLYIETSRGCPYGCEYCLSSADRQVRMFSEEYVMRLLQKIKESKVRQVKLLDRTFNSNPQRALRIARYMNEECKNQIFQFEIVAETLSEELLDYFANTADKKRFRFEIGVQSFHAETLKAVGRIQNNQRLKEVITRLKDADVIMHVDLIAGLPYEDLSTFRASFDELFSLRAKELQLGILKLLKGTRLKQKEAQYGFQYEQAAPYAVLKTDWLTEEELQMIHDSAEAVEKFWNSGCCRRTITSLLDDGYEESAFTIFEKLGKALAGLPRPYAPQQFFQLFYQAFPLIDHALLTAMLFTDYYGLYKQRPAHFGNMSVDAQTRLSIQKLALAKGLKKHDLYHYTFFTYAYHKGSIIHQLVIYNASQTLPKRYWVDVATQQIEEMKE